MLPSLLLEMPPRICAKVLMPKSLLRTVVHQPVAARHHVVSRGQLRVTRVRPHPCFVLLLPLTLVNMADGESPAPKGSSTGFFKNLGKRLKKPVSRSHSRSSSPQPSTALQDNPSRERPLAHRAGFSSVSRLTGSIAGTSATIPQKGDFMDYHLLRGMLSPVQMITHQPSCQDLSHRCRVLDHPSLQQFRVSNFPSYKL